VKKILFVDHDQRWVNIYQTVFYTSKEWDCYYADDVLGAIDFLNYIQFDLIVTDIALPLFDGTQLLEYVKNRYPDVIRLILTDCDSIDNYLQVVRLAHQFLRKTESVQQIEEIIQNMYRLHRLVINKKARRMVGALDSLPSLPDAYYQLKDELNRSEPSLKKIGEVIESDVGLSTTVLKIVNSAFFTLPQQVTTPSQAVVLLGTEIIKSMVVTAHIFSHFEEKDICQSVTVVMKHSQMVAGFAGHICEHHGVREKTRDTVVMAAMLHDIGRLIFEAYLHEKYQKALNISNVTSESLSESERNVLGVDHADIGAYLLGLWGFRFKTVEAVAFHHSPRRIQSDSNMLLSILHVADVVALEKLDSDASFGTEYIDQTYVEKHIGHQRWDEWRTLCLEYYDTVWKRIDA
jgi:putative nucleotidyltransferase with HDIG domain